MLITYYKQLPLIENAKNTSLTVSLARRYMKCASSNKTCSTMIIIHGRRNLRWSCDGWSTEREYTQVNVVVRKKFDFICYCNSRLMSIIIMMTIQNRDVFEQNKL